MAGDRGTAATARPWRAPRRRCRAPAGRGIRAEQRGAAQRAQHVAGDVLVDRQQPDRNVLIASTVTPPSPATMNGPNCGSSRTPRIISTPSTISCTRKPSRRAPRRHGRRAAPSSLRPRRAPPPRRAARARRRRPRSCGSPGARRSSPRPGTRCGRHAPPPHPASWPSALFGGVSPCVASSASKAAPSRLSARPRGSGNAVTPRRSAAA